MSSYYILLSDNNYLCSNLAGFVETEASFTTAIIIFNLKNALNEGA